MVGAPSLRSFSGDEQRDRQGTIPVHQASILFTFMVLVMGAVWVAMTELGGAEAVADEPAVVVASLD
jgi:hypothetical protein